VKQKVLSKGKRPGLTADITNRIRAVREALGLNKKMFAASLGKSPSYISIIELGRRIPAIDFFILLVQVHNANPEFLLTGKGEIFKDGRKKDHREFIDYVENINDVLWLIDNSPIARNDIHAFAAKYFFQNEEMLKRNVELYLSKKKAKNQGG
jgi:transcriptional regulator with XRE-family HTH domain